MKRRLFKKQIHFIYFILIVLVCSITISTFLLLPKSHLSSHHDPIRRIEIKKNITVVNSDTGESQTVDLPVKLPLGNYHYSFIPTNDSAEKELYLYIEGNYSTFTMECGDDVIYHYEPLDTNVVSSGGIFIRVIKIPRKYYGKKIRLSFHPIVDSLYGIHIPMAALGTREELIMNHPNKNIPLFIINFLMFIFSIESFFILLYLVISKKIPLLTLMIPLFAFCNAAYLIIRTPSSYMMLGKGAVLYIGEYLLFMILPITCAVFFSSTFKQEERKGWQVKSYLFLSYAMIINMLMQMLLTFLGVSEFMAMQKTTLYLMMLFFLSMLLLQFSKKNQHHKHPTLMLSMITLFFTFAISMADYAFTSQIHYTALIGFSGFIFLLFQVWVGLTIYVNRYRTIHIKKIYKKIVFRDTLTTLKNLPALKQDIEKLKKKINTKITIVLIDLNNLKIINNTCGHKTGDDLIKMTANILLGVENNFPKTNAYRISGNEFILISLGAQNETSEDIERYIRNEVRKIKKSNMSLPFHLSIKVSTALISRDFKIDTLVQKNESNDARSQTI